MNKVHKKNLSCSSLHWCHCMYLRYSLIDNGSLMKKWLKIRYNLQDTLTYLRTYMEVYKSDCQFLCFLINTNNAFCFVCVD